MTIQIVKLHTGVNLLLQPYIITHHVGVECGDLGFSGAVDCSPQQPDPIAHEHIGGGDDDD